MYEVKQRTFRTIDNKHAAVFGLREGTSDFNTINSAFREDEYALLEFPFKEGDVFIDIGVHIGGVSILAAIAYRGLKVLAFEPVKENYDLLVKNIEVNGLQSSITPFHLAVSKKSGDTIKIYLGDKGSENGRHHRFIGVQTGKGDYQEIKTISLNEIMKDISVCHYLKVDTEGAEYEIFDGASKETLKKIKYIFGEVHSITTKYELGIDSIYKLTKGVFQDITPFVERMRVPGHFIFINENSS